jgi:hypothetical protein
MLAHYNDKCESNNQEWISVNHKSAYMVSSDICLDLSLRNATTLSSFESFDCFPISCFVCETHLPS